MESQDQQILYSLSKTVESLSDTMQKTRAELDGLRTVTTGVLNALASDPQNVPGLAAAIQGVIEADTARVLASSMSDDMLEQRWKWMQALLPPQLQALVKKP